MHRGHEYGDLQQVKKEVSDNALTMIQAGVPQNVKVGLSQAFPHFLCTDAVTPTFSLRRL